MQEFTIVIHSLEGILEFVALCQRQHFDITAGNENQLVSAKNYIGMCALDWSRPVQVRFPADGEGCDGFRQAAQRFLLK